MMRASLCRKVTPFPFFRSKNYLLVPLNQQSSSGEDLFPILPLSIVRIPPIEVPSKITLILDKVIED